MLLPMHIDLRITRGVVEGKHELGARACRGGIEFQVDGRGPYYVFEQGTARKVTTSLLKLAKRLSADHVIELCIERKLVVRFDSAGAHAAAGLFWRKAAEIRRAA